MNKELVAQEALLEEQMKPFFNIIKANVSRSRMTISVVFLKVSPIIAADFHGLDDVNDEFTKLFLSKIRNTDVLFKLSEELQWGIILTQSGEIEAQAFLMRLFDIIKNDGNSLNKDFNFTIEGIIAEIRNDEVTFEKILDIKSTIFTNEENPWGINIVTDFKNPPMETIKISILEDNDIFRNVLKNTIQKMPIEQTQLEIETFTDGYEFLESNWYLSGHTHIVIMNDILPRKNGVEVLHTLRRMANQKKFIVYMMTNRNSQGDMITAYENGVDQYLKKPFDLRLFEAQLKRTFARLWS